MSFYVDTSAAAKLVVAEAESPALLSWARDHDGALVSSDLCRTELLRATRRAAPDRMVQARAVLDSLTLLGLPASTFERAALLDPTMLRSLDAIHLACALDLGDELEGFVTYDDRLGAAARGLGLPVVAPS